MKKLILLIAVVALASCTTPTTETPVAAVDSSAVCKDSVKTDSLCAPVVADTTKK